MTTDPTIREGLSTGRTVVDVLIRSRDTLLDRILGITKGRVLVEPRIHFALNCASRSCPPVGVYDPQHIDSQLEVAARNFVTQEVEVDPARKTLRLPHIFRWYARDFGGRAGVLTFVANYLADVSAREWLRRHRRAVKWIYVPYDWLLNT
jgi:hypothetical protein